MTDSPKIDFDSINRGFPAASGADGISTTDARLRETQQAFDSVAADYDGPRGNNALIQRMRETVWRTVTSEVAPGGRLLDLGCGTGLDAAYFAGRGYQVVATDWSPRMVERTRERAAAGGLSHRLRALTVGIHELDRLEAGAFDAIYSNFGPLNCVPDLDAVARSCAALLVPGGTFVASIMGRVCPWEFAYYLTRRRFARARVRAASGVVPVGMNNHTVWAWYFTPREFYRPFADRFALKHYEALGLFLPPPYLIDVYERRPRLCGFLGWLDDRLGALPLLRDSGDHFLIVMTRHRAG